MTATSPGSRSENVVAAKDAAKSAGLVNVNDQDEGYSRRKAGKGWSYRDTGGRRITDPKIVARINAIGIPLAYARLICAHENGHIQATGRDAKVRKQYRYHTRFREVRDSTEYLLTFAEAFRTTRGKMDTDMGTRGLPRDKMLATIVRLLETTTIRVGNADYAKQNKRYGLTTLNDRHVKVEGGQAAKRNVRAAIETVSSRLGNTPTACRKSYVHPESSDSYMADALVLAVHHEVQRELRDEIAELLPEEALVLAFLQRRLDEKLSM